MKAPDTIQTTRLFLRKPTAADGEAIFSRYSADPVVTRFMSWPRHRSIADTEAFLEWSDADWERWPAGSYLIFDQSQTQLLGGTGLGFQTPSFAITGYVLAQDAWGKGFATEALKAMIDLAAKTEVRRLEATCHIDHRASARVLEKCGFMMDRIDRSSVIFPNNDPENPADIRIYSRTRGPKLEESHS